MWDRTILDHTVAEWTGALAIAVGAWLVGKLLYWLFAVVLKRWTELTTTRADDVIVGTVGAPVVLLATLAGFQIAFGRMHFTDQVALYGAHAFTVAWTLGITWLVVRTVSALLHEYLLPYAKKRGLTAMDASVEGLTVRTAAMLIWGIGIIAALNNVGYNVNALLAGVGISGLALAMAAKDTVANVFGGITVFTDQPFRVGDRIRIAGYDGTVLRVGVRSTRIRTIEGPVVVVPNYRFTDTVVENVSEEDGRRVRHELGLVMHTPPERMERALEVLRELVHAHQADLMPGHGAVFSGFGDFSLRLVFVYRVRKGADIDATQNRVHLDLLRRFAAEGLEFAYPTQVAISGDHKA
ncbi:MAG: mechanosensitive ion channel family protein [Flavobacteriales bacterium]|jgi:MscS family membrane protein|nr:mechanosensitive ion channel family protein [Flavobacteriales bacterium]